MATQLRVLRSLQCYEHIIRDEKEWDMIRLYIETNPQKWEEDEEILAKFLGEGEQGKINV